MGDNFTWIDMPNQLDQNSVCVLKSPELLKSFVVVCLVTKSCLMFL